MGVKGERDVGERRGRRRGRELRKGIGGYWSHRPGRSDRSHRSDRPGRPDGSYRSDWPDRSHRPRRRYGSHR